MKIAPGLLLSLCLALLVSGCATNPKASSPSVTRLPDAPAQAGHPTEHSFKNHTVRVFHNANFEDLDRDHLEIWRGNEKVFVGNGYSFAIGKLPHGDPNPLTQMGRDLTGDGQPDLLIVESTGGAHCCHIIHLFQIGREFRKIATINAKDSDPEFKDLRGDGTVEIVMNDCTFAYWNTSFASSPLPKIILRFQNSRYRLDHQLMREPAPDAAALSAQAQDLAKDFTNMELVDGNENWKAPSTLWGALLDHIYAGNLDTASKLLDQSWPAHHPGKARFWVDLTTRLQTSPYYEDLRSLNSRNTPKLE